MIHLSSSFLSIPSIYLAKFPSPITTRYFPFTPFISSSYSLYCSASSNKSPEPSLEPTKKVSVHFRDGGKGGGDEGKENGETTKIHLERNGVGPRKTGEKNETNVFPPFSSHESPPAESLETQGSNTLPASKRLHNLPTLDEPQPQQQQKRQQSKTLPRALQAWSIALPSLGRNEAGSDDEKPRSRKGSNFLQLFSLKDQTLKRTRSDPHQQQQKSKSDSEAQRLNVRGAFDAVTQAEEDKTSQESGVKKKKSRTL